jgi:hypothetical protein
VKTHRPSDGNVALLTLRRVAEMVWRKVQA